MWLWKGNVGIPNFPGVSKRWDILWPFGVYIKVGDLHFYKVFGFEFGDFNKFVGSPYESWVRTMFLPYDQRISGLYGIFLLNFVSSVFIVKGLLSKSQLWTLIGSFLILSSLIIFYVVMQPLSLEWVSFGFYACFFLLFTGLSSTVYEFYKQKTTIRGEAEREEK